MLKKIFEVNNKTDLFTIFYIGLTVSLLFVFKTIFFESCFGFDSNDDANHTFVNLKSARDIIKEGALPFINLYNNFGTPLIGDALTYPFSIQSITYWFFNNETAMTVNRSTIVFFTFICTTFFLKRYLSTFSSVICSLIIIFSPGVFWNLAHHHYQFSLLGFSIILLIQASFMNLKMLHFLILLWIAYVIFFLSTSIQLVCLSLPFLILFLPVENGFKNIKSSILNIVALFSSLIFITPQLIIFLTNVSLSIRLNWSPYSGILSTTREQLLSLIVPAGEWMHYGINGHFSIVTYFSITFLVLSLLGFTCILFNIKSNYKILRISILLGLIPSVLAFILQFHGNDLPIIRSVDSTRVWWFSNLFLVLSIGFFIDALKKETLPIGVGILSLIVSIFIGYQYLRINTNIPEFKHLSNIHHIVLIGTIIVTFSFSILALISKLPNKNNNQSINQKTIKYKKIYYIIQNFIISIIVILALTPSIVNILGFNLKSCGPGNHFFSKKDKASFEPKEFFNSMEPFNRLTAIISPVRGYDLKAIQGNMFGSSSRSIISNQSFKNTLDKNNLIRTDDNYFFKLPLQQHKINELGIRYILTLSKNMELEKNGWKNKDKSLDGSIYLYENPSKASIVYLKNQSDLMFLSSFKIIDNGIEINLPSINVDQDLIVTFFNRNGWEANIDGKISLIKTTDLGMISIPIKNNDKKIILQFKSLNTNLFYIFIFTSMLIIFITSLILRKSKVDS